MSLGTFPLNTVGLTPHQLAACQRAGLHNAEDVLLHSPAELNRKLRYTRVEAVQDLIKAVSKGIVPQTSTLLEIVNAEAGPSRPTRTNGTPRRSTDDDQDADEAEDEDEAELGKWTTGNCIRTGDKEFDLALGGGLRVGTLTEITGESASGKSHLALTLALTCQIPSLTTRPGGAIILTSEGELATDRLVQISKPLISAHAPRTGLKHSTLLHNIHTTRCEDIDQLEQLLAYKVPSVLEAKKTHTHSPMMGQRPGHHASTNGTPGVNGHASSSLRPRGGLPIRLLIIDSITALVRGSDKVYANSSTAGLTLRSQHLCSVADKLKLLAVEYELAVLVLNQVSDVFSRPPPLPPSLTQSSTSTASQYYSNYPEPPMLYSTQARWFSGQSETLQKEAALGVVWANALNTRIMLSRTGRRRLLNPEDLTMISRKRMREQQELNQAHGVLTDGQDGEGLKPSLIRRLHVVFSAFASPGTVDFVITPEGVHALPDSYRPFDLAEAMKRVKAKQAAEEDDGYGLSESQAVVEDAMPNEPAEELYEDVFDDLGDLPSEFWEGKWDGNGQEIVGGEPKLANIDDGGA